jgi:hypothetical protein
MSTGLGYYILVQGSAKFSSHCDQGMLLQLLWFLYLGGVANEQIKAFFRRFGAIDGYPLVAPGKGPYKMPPPYDNEDCVDWTMANLGARITKVIAWACLADEIDHIVLVYSNHGPQQGLGAGHGLLSKDDFALWAIECARAGKQLLVVIDACFSTGFATDAMDFLRGKLAKQAPLLDFVEKNVGFITSARGICARSTPMISKDRSLVNLFAPSPDRQDTWARGFFTRSSMFLRQFNWLLAYAPPDPKLTLGQFVRQMNVRRFADGHGFYAALVGGSSFGSVQFNSFFPMPLGTLDPTTEVPEWPEVTVGDLIPGAKLGHLYDDVRQLEEEDGEGEGEEGVEEEEPNEQAPEPGTASFLLIPIVRHADGTVGRAGRALLSEDLGLDFLFLSKLCVGHSTVEDEEEDEAGARAPERLEVGHLFVAACHRFARNKVPEARSAGTVARCTSTEVVERCRLWQTYLEERLDVEVPHSAWESLARLTRFRGLFASDADFERFLEELRDRALAQLPEFQPAYPNVTPIEDD